MDPKPPGPPPPPPAATVRKPPPTPPAPPTGIGARPSIGRTTQTKIEFAATALRLRDEQIEAKVVYFGADQRTNKDLDAITEQVIAELKALQTASAKAAPVAPPAEDDNAQIEIELIGNLRGLMEKLFSSRREGFLRKKIELIQRRITTLFFNSELFHKISAGAAEARTFQWPDQAMYYVIRKRKEMLVQDLKSLQYADAEVQAEAIQRITNMESGLRMEVLSRTTPELEKLLGIYCNELIQFLQGFRENMGEFCWEVIRESRVAKGKLYGYKLPADRFQSFREVFDKKFLERLVLDVQEPVLRKSEEMRDAFREETLRFVADPHIFSEICSVLCDAVYDYLHTEGFLDLPSQWRAHLDRHA